MNANVILEMDCKGFRVFISSEDMNVMQRRCDLKLRCFTRGSSWGSLSGSPNSSLDDLFVSQFYSLHSGDYLRDTAELIFIVSCWFNSTENRVCSH